MMGSDPEDRRTGRDYVPSEALTDEERRLLEEFHALRNVFTAARDAQENAGELAPERGIADLAADERALISALRSGDDFSVVSVSREGMAKLPAIIYDFSGMQPINSVTVNYAQSITFDEAMDMKAKNSFNWSAIDKQAVIVIASMAALIAGYFAVVESPSSLFRTQVNLSDSAHRSSPSP